MEQLWEGGNTEDEMMELERKMIELLREIELVRKKIELKRKEPKRKEQSRIEELIEMKRKGQMINQLVREKMELENRKPKLQMEIRGKEQEERLKFGLGDERNWRRGLVSKDSDEDSVKQRSWISGRMLKERRLKMAKLEEL
ncbi:hypothetical protein JCGZ_26992 [Jatropha curcas]|uniref:Uncharacterized protein n=1 Tax=Jatropha curcas TaxID=180498 RepID=A0A067LCZ6_JATCU|nr:hypothetical protein JCGZ_26992 [Jatropha curcas]